MKRTTGSPTSGLDGAGMLPPVAPPPKSAAKNRVPHRFADINEFIDRTQATLKPSEVAVWLVLWRDTKPNGEARTGVAGIARRTGYSARMVKYAVAGLIAKNLVKVVRRGRLGTGVTVYRVRGVNPAAQ